METAPPSTASPSIPDAVAGLRGRLTIAAYRPGACEPDHAVAFENLITNLGRYAVLHFLANDGIITAGAQYLGVGTGSGTPAAADTALFGELARRPIVTSVVSGNQLTLQAYFGTTQGNGTWTECGVFGNGATANAGSGMLFTHAAISYTKTNTYQVVLTYTITLS